MIKNRDYPFLSIAGININLVQIPDIVKYLAVWIDDNDQGNYVVIANANDVIAAKKDIRVREAINSSSLSVPDGFSLVLYARFVGQSLKRRAYGPDLMLEFLKLSEVRGYSHFFYGATDKTLDLLLKNIKERFPAIQIAGTYAPPFRQLSQEEDLRVIDSINKSDPDVIWVGLGCPKQQLWMYEHRNRLNVPVMVGVGAAFDFLAGTKPQAPRWIRDNGFEWLFRLVTEPKRLWRRYLVDYPLFAYFVVLDLFGKLFSRSKESFPKG